MANNARITDPNMLIQAGIDPRTGLPIKLGNCGSYGVDKQNIRKQLRIVDEQNALYRYTWYGLPPGLNQELVERVLYYRGQGAFFQINGKAYFLPYALDGEIDVYGRYLGITPLPFNGAQKKGDEDKPWVQGLTFEPVYEMLTELDILAIPSLEAAQQKLDKSCVLLHDYAQQIAQTNIPRQTLQDPLLDVMADCIPFMRTALLNGTGITGIRVGNEDERASVEAASSAINEAALNGRKYVGVMGSLDFQELTGGQVAKAEEFMLAMQSLDNYRLSLYGLDNGGLFQKRQHMLEAEQEMAGGNTALVYADGLTQRQNACLIANSIFGWNMWCMPSEDVMPADIDGDGLIQGDAQPTSGGPQENTETGGEE